MGYGKKMILLLNFRNVKEKTNYFGFVYHSENQIFLKIKKTSCLCEKS